LQSLFTNAPGSAIQAILKQRESQPFKDVGQFTQLLPPDTRVPNDTLDVASGYFLVTIGIRTGRLVQQSEALIARSKNQANVLWTRPNPVQPKPVTETHG